MNKNNQIRIPRLAELILKLLISKNLQYSVLGDFEEIFYSIYEDRGILVAKTWYWMQAIKSIPNFLMDKFYWGSVLLKNYIKVAIRNLSKNKQASFINITGLSVAIGIAIVAFVFFDFNYNRDNFHKEAENIYLVQNVIKNNDRYQLWGNSPLPIAKSLKNDFASINDIVRINYNYATVRSKDNVFSERVEFVDESFFDVFTFPLLYGSAKDFNDKNSVIISYKTFEKYFSKEENPIGNEILITFNNYKQESYIIKGVAEKIPDNSSFYFNICIPFNKQLDLGIDYLEDWKENISASFIKLNNKDDIKIIKENGVKYVEIQNEANFERKIVEYRFEPLLTMARNISGVRAGIVNIRLQSGQIWGMFFTGIFLLLIACINYINIAIVSASRRYKEVGIRKVIGGHKSNLIIQFLSENTVLCLIALIFGVLLGKYLFVPGFNNLYGVFNLKVNLLSNYKLLIFLLGLLVLTGIGAGLYPALYISSFQPANIFRSKIKFRSKNIVSKVFLTFQIILSILTLVYGVVFVENTYYQKERDWGYNKDQVLSIELEKSDQFSSIRNSIVNNKNVINVSGSVDHVGRTRKMVSIEHNLKQFDINQFGVGDNYIETMGIELISGRTFSKEINTDIQNSIIVNETFVKNLELENPIGSRILYKKKPFYIVGIVKDFHYINFMNKIEPIAFFKNDEKDFNYISVKVNKANIENTEKTLESLWKNNFPDSPYKVNYQDSIFDGYFNAMDGVAKNSVFTSLVALFLSCMGIFGLVGINIEKRMKEMSIRKILGADTFDVVKLINKDFILIFIIAGIIGIPSSYFGVTILLDSLWKYHQEINSFPFIFAVSLITFSAIVTIVSQILKSIKRNPVDYLRSE